MNYEEHAGNEENVQMSGTGANLLSKQMLKEIEDEEKLSMGQEGLDNADMQFDQRSVPDKSPEAPRVKPAFA